MGVSRLRRAAASSSARGMLSSLAQILAKVGVFCSLICRSGTRFRNPLSSLIFSALLVTLFALAFTPQMASARAYRPFVYDATDAMLSAFVIQPVTRPQPFQYDATGAMLDAITVKSVFAARPLYYDATAVMLQAISSTPLRSGTPPYYDTTGVMLCNVVLP